MGKLAALLKSELERWSQKSYAQLSAIEYPQVYSVGKAGDAGWCEVEATLLEKNDDYVHVSLAVSRGGLSAFFPSSSSVIAYRGATPEEMIAQMEADPLIQMERRWRRNMREGQRLEYDADEVQRAWANTRYPNAMLSILALLDRRAALATALPWVAQTWPDFFGDIASLDLTGPLSEVVERVDEATWPGFFGMSRTIGDRMVEAIRVAVPNPLSN